ncbi:MAG: DUF3160 domain-containing protein [Coriobacteriales bacterium]|jgi:hypothetical protein|nr:DUF3160 domain-containing protein [Coriobacteriales bacterium]
MFCSACGRKIEAGFKFCPYCQAPVEGDMSAAPAQGGFKKRYAIIPAVAVVLIAAVVVAVSALLPKGDAAEPAATEPEGRPVNEFAAVSFNKPFAEYAPYTYTATPVVQSYIVERDLSNIANLQQYNDPSYFYTAKLLSEPDKEKLVTNGFVVDASSNYKEFFGVYETNRYGYVPSFITTDSAVHSFHLMFDYVLKDLEQQKLFALIATLSTNMAATSAEQYEALKGTEFENAARRNVAFFSVGARLSNAEFVEPAYVSDLVNAELALIEAQAGIADSPVINAGETFENPTVESLKLDYTQFIPRSHYTLTPELTAYFKAQMWFGQLTFRSAYQDEVKSALLITSGLKQGTNEQYWYQLFEPINFFVGECDDITFYQYEKAIAPVYGEGLASTAVISDAERFSAALEVIQKLDPPQINSMPIFNEAIQPDRDAAITGFRFLGQRFTIDAAIFQQLMDRTVPERMLPKALDIPAAFGSDEATEILRAEGEMAAYPNYEEKLNEAKQYLTTVPEETWNSNLYWGWLNALRTLADNNDKTGLPLFMQNSAWDRKELNTFEGSWTELKHDTVLYAKQPMAEMGGGGPNVPPPDDRGYVEPNPELFGRLASLTQMTIDGLSSRGLLTEEAATSLATLNSLSRSFTIMAEKELANEPLTSEEYEIIRTYGAELEHIWTTVKADEFNGVSPFHYLEQHPGAIVTDVATDPYNGLVLTEATGYAQAIFVAIPRDGQVVIARGVVFSQYEFTVPLDGRMTDAAWHERILAGDFPPQAAWKESFLSNLGTEFTWAQQ